MNKELKFVLGYLVGMWLTYGYHSTLFGQQFHGRNWSEIDGFLASAVWPLYWFYKSAEWVWS